MVGMGEGRRVGVAVVVLDGGLVGNVDGVGGGLAGDGYQESGFDVGANDSVDRLHSGLDVRNIRNFDGNDSGAVLDDDLSEFVGAVNLSADEAEDKLMVCLVEAGGFEQVGGVDGVDEIGDSDAGEQQFCAVGGDQELRYLAALHDDRADTGEAVERRLQVVGGDLPYAPWRDGVGGEAVGEDGEGREGEGNGGEPGRWGQGHVHL